MFFAPLGYNVADIFWHFTCAVFPKLKLGNHGEWGLETRYRELHCIFSRATRIFISRCSRYFIRVSQTAYLIICQYLRHSYLSTYFLSRIVHLYKILVQLYFIERIFSFRLLSILNLSLLIPFLIIFQEDVMPLFWRNVSITYRPKVEKIN